MTRREGLFVLAIALALVVVGAVWAFGPVALILAGLILAAFVLFTVDIEEKVNGEALEAFGPPR
jgi:hypothetical protein